MLKTAEDFSAVVEVDAWHLQAVAPQPADSMTSEQSGDNASQPDSRAKQLREASQIEPELPVKPTLGIGKPRNVSQRVSFENRSVTTIVAHVDKYNAAPGGFNLAALSRNVCKRLATERAAGMPQEDHKLRLRICEFIKTLSRVGPDFPNRIVRFQFEIGGPNRLMMPYGSPENHCKRDPPDQIVRDEGPSQ